MQCSNLKPGLSSQRGERSGVTVESSSLESVWKDDEDEQTPTLNIYIPTPTKLLFLLLIIRVSVAPIKVMVPFINTDRIYDIYSRLDSFPSF